LVVLGSAVAGTLLLGVVSDPVGGEAVLGIAGVVAVLAIFVIAFVLARSLRGGVS
jgi:hypothetical protein